MKVSAKIGSALATVAVVGIITTSIGPQHATAQQKGIVVPQLVRNVDEPGFNPYQASQNILFTNFSGDATFTIPQNKVAVIEQVSASGALQTGSVPQVFVRCRNESVEVNHSLPVIPQGEVNGLTVFAGSEPFKCYATAPPGTLNVHVQSGTLQTAQHTWVMAVSGYLVPE